jgi:hypothetical protein
MSALAISTAEEAPNPGAEAEARRAKCAAALNVFERDIASVAKSATADFVRWSELCERYMALAVGSAGGSAERKLRASAVKDLDAAIARSGERATKAATLLQVGGLVALRGKDAVLALPVGKVHALLPLVERKGDTWRVKEKASAAADAIFASAATLSRDQLRDKVREALPSSGKAKKAKAEPAEPAKEAIGPEWLEVFCSSVHVDAPMAIAIVRGLAEGVRGTPEHHQAIWEALCTEVQRQTAALRAEGHFQQRPQPPSVAKGRRQAV